MAELAEGTAGPWNSGKICYHKHAVYIYTRNKEEKAIKQNISLNICLKICTQTMEFFLSITSDPLDELSKFTI